MSRYKAYPEYKDSGVEWLGEIPPHWHSRQLKYLCSYNDEVLSETASDDYEIEYVDISSVSAINGISSTETMLFGNAPSRARRIVRDGDILISTVRTYLEAIASVQAPPKNLIASTGFAVIRPNFFLNKGYAAYCLRASGFIKEVVARSVGVSYPAINASDLVNIKTPEPSVPEQEKIAAFLDHETAKIDALIEKQQRLIELLKEKRQAVISHAVTRGLNPNAPMQDSGVEWLGEVPAHWGMTKFHYEIDLLEGPGILANDFHDEGVPLLRIQNVKDEFVSRDYKTYLSPSKVRAKWDHFRVAQGDLIISCSATTGLVSEVGEDTVGAVPYTGLIRLRPQVKASITKEFIRCLVQSDLFFEQIKLLQSGSTIQHFGPYHLQQMHITLPALTEQNKIAKAVKEKTARLDKLISIADQQIELMQERRTALISAAVTGKIDVRDWQAAA